MATLTIYFKSGNIVNVKNVTEWSVGSKGNEITSISLTHKKPLFNIGNRKLIVKSIDMKAIDCIIER